jgi:transcriptional regulator with XRE-family HTH domain
MVESLGNNIRALRKKKGLSQKELAEQIMVSPQAISKWENDRSMPDITMIGVLATLFECSIDEVLGRQNEGQETGVAEKPEETGLPEQFSSAEPQQPRLRKYGWLNPSFILFNFIVYLVLGKFFMFEHAPQQYVMLVILIVGTISTYLLLALCLLEKYQDKYRLACLVMNALIFCLLVFIFLILPLFN